MASVKADRAASRAVTWSCRSRPAHLPSPPLSPFSCRRWPRTALRCTARMWECSGPSWRRCRSCAGPVDWQAGRRDSVRAQGREACGVRVPPVCRAPCCGWCTASVLGSARPVRSEGSSPRHTRPHPGLPTRHIPCPRLRSPDEVAACTTRLRSLASRANASASLAHTLDGRGAARPQAGRGVVQPSTMCSSPACPLLRRMVEEEGLPGGRVGARTGRSAVARAPAVGAAAEDERIGWLLSPRCLLRAFWVGAAAT